MQIDEKYLNEALANHAKTLLAISAIIQNLEHGNFKIIICDDGIERDVTAENIENLKRAIKP